MSQKKRNVFAVWGLVFGIIATLAFLLIVQSASKEQTTAQLTGKPWTWLSLTTSTGQETKPNKADAFVLTFNEDNRFSSTTDCNTLTGSYSINADSIAFSQVASTMMYCEGSEEQVYAQIFADARSFLITRDGVLELELQNNSIARFR